MARKDLRKPTIGSTSVVDETEATSRKNEPVYQQMAKSRSLQIITDFQVHI
jgi:hypothetical protein